MPTRKQWCNCRAYQQNWITQLSTRRVIFRELKSFTAVPTIHIIENQYPCIISRECRLVCRMRWGGVSGWRKCMKPFPGWICPWRHEESSSSIYSIAWHAPVQCGSLCRKRDNSNRNEPRWCLNGVDRSMVPCQKLVVMCESRCSLLFDVSNYFWYPKKSCTLHSRTRATIINVY